MVFAWMEVVRSQEGKNDVMIFWGDTETPMTHKRKNKRQSFFSTYCKKVLIALRSILLLYYEGTVCPPIFTEEYINLNRYRYYTVHGFISFKKQKVPYSGRTTA